ncbi:MAG: leucine-rich repeat protein [Bacteroidales bacterium]|jgi:hypothetical protein|nr:leucine-rich repeat protein [Bacteroidales bacterium]
MKKLNVFLVIATLSLTMNNLFAADTVTNGTINETVNWILTTDSVFTVSGEGDMPDYNSWGSPWYNDRQKIKDVVIETGVTRIGNNAFNSCSNLFSVIIGDSVKSIGRSAFENGENLYSVVFGRGIKEIDMYAFENCNNLSTVSFNADSCGDFSMGFSHPFSNITTLETINIGSNVKRIPAYFAYRLKLRSIDIPNSVTSIGVSAFGFCDSLTDVIIGSGVKKIEYSAFGYCGNLANVYFNADSCVNFAVTTFTNDTMLQTINIGNNVKLIPSNFAKELRLSYIDIPNSVQLIGGSAFYNCTNLLSVSMGNGVKNIGDYAFSGCTNLANINFSDSLKIIGSNAFAYCRNIISITIPESVTSIGSYAFSNMLSLDTVRVFWDMPVDIESMGVFSGVPDISQTKLIVPCSAIQDYKAASDWKKFDVICDGYNVNTENTLKAGYKALLSYPNPTVNGVVTIKPTKAGEALEIYNIAGKRVGIRVTSEQESTLNLQELPKGAYFVKVGGKTAKVVKL